MRRLMGEKGFGDDPDFRWRGGEVSRIEGLSDAVFAFSMTLLIVSLEVPKTFSGLMDSLKQFPAFGISFLFLFFIWYQHYVFFRRYGLNNQSVVVVNGILMFLVLFFIYPFRWLISLLINGLFFNSFLELNMPVGVDLKGFNMTDYAVLHSFYASGLIAINLCFMWFYYKALCMKNVLALDYHEEHITRTTMAGFVVVIAISVISITLVWVVPQPYNGAASGWIFMLIWPITFYLESRKPVEPKQSEPETQDLKSEQNES